MKKKLLALACALALCASLAGCTLATPAAVGTLGEVEIPAGIYLLAQFQAYQTARNAANSDQTDMTVAQYLKQTIPLDADGQPDAAANVATADAASSQAEDGETAPDDTVWVTVSDYVAGETERLLRQYAAVETRFAQLGGELTDEQTAQADAYAQQLWDNYGDTYAANGIGLESLKRYEYNYYKLDALLELVYGPDGEQPVPDQELTAYLQQQMYYGSYVVVPLYNTSTYAFADEEQTAAMLAECQAAVEQYNALQAQAGEDADGTAAANFYTALAQHLPDVYAVLDAEYTAADLSGDFAVDLFGYDELAGSFSDEALQAVTGLEFGQAAAVQYSSFAAIVFLRQDPLQTYELDDLRATVLGDMKNDELTQSLEEFGETLANGLNQSAMGKFPAKKIAAAG